MVLNRVRTISSSSPACCERCPRPASSSRSSWAGSSCGATWPMYDGVVSRSRTLGVRGPHARAGRRPRSTRTRSCSSTSTGPPKATPPALAIRGPAARGQRRPDDRRGRGRDRRGRRRVPGPAAAASRSRVRRGRPASPRHRCGATSPSSSGCTPPPSPTARPCCPGKAACARAAASPPRRCARSSATGGWSGRLRDLFTLPGGRRLLLHADGHPPAPAPRLAPPPPALRLPARPARVRARRRGRSRSSTPPTRDARRAPWPCR